MRAKKLLIWTWVALVMLMFTGTAWADVYFSIATAEDWEEALYGGSIKPVTSTQWDEYMMDWQMFCEEGEPYPDNKFCSADLYVYQGGEPEFSEGGLVMAWGNEGMELGDYSSAWQFHYGKDPDLTNTTITITVIPPQFDLNGNQINVVSFGIVDINGNIRAWYWNVGQPGDPIPWWTPTTITINTALNGVMAANPIASAYMNTPGFDITQAQSFIVDENAQWVGGATPVPPPGQTVIRPWNYWDNLSVRPNPTTPIIAGINPDIHQDIPGVEPNDFHIEGRIESGPWGGNWSYPPRLVQHIDGPFTNFRYSIKPDYSDPGQNWYIVKADWWSGQGVPFCTVIHLGLFFEVSCHNVVIDLVGWWTLNGKRVKNDPQGVPLPIGGFAPILGFAVQDNIGGPPIAGGLPQSIRIQNGVVDESGGPVINEEGGPPIEVFVVKMDLTSVNKEELYLILGEDPFRELCREGLQEYLPWVEVFKGDLPISEFNPEVMGPDSIFDVLLDASGEIYPRDPMEIEPGGFLISRKNIQFIGNGGSNGESGPQMDQMESQWVWHIHQAHEQEDDLGDAPDSSNSHGNIMNAYPWGAVQANFPTVYIMGSPPHGPIHWFPLQVAHLGPNVTLESEADVGPDQDPTNNIVPPMNWADLDLADDGLINLPMWLPHCMYRRFVYQVNIINAPAGTTLYFNSWADWDRDGDWNDSFICSAGPAPEWIVQDQDVIAALGGAPVAPGLYNVVTPLFLSYHIPGTSPNRPLWLRATLSETKWSGSSASGAPPFDGGSGPAGGYLFGETEDYYFRPKADCPDYDNSGDTNLVDWAYFTSWWLLKCRK